MATMITFNPAQSVHVGTSGFSNYTPGNSESVVKMIRDVFARFPKAVIVNGDDDWYKPRSERPETFETDYGVKPLAYFHTGVSGISKTGIVISWEDFQNLPVAIRTSHKLRICLAAP